jgi:hypothetical protein
MLKIDVTITATHRHAPVISDFSISPASGQIGGTFTATPTITGRQPITLGYQWMLGGAPIAGATGSTYKAVSAGELTVVVTATNHWGTARRESQQTKIEATASAPAVTAAAISPSSGAVGTTFTAGHTAAGNPVPAIGYQWRLNGTAIAGATASTYQAAAAGSLTVVVTATNSQGTASRESQAVTVSAPLAAPTNAALPTISGTAEVGQSLTAASDGTWTGNPAPTLARNWQRNGVDIPAATASSYRLVDADNGASIRLRVTATNSQGSASAHSQAVTVAAFVAPAVTAAAISPSSGGVGTTFTASHTAAGNPVPTIGYQWRLNGTAIAGATASTYQAAAAGSLTVVVTATNSQGTASRESQAVTVSAPLAAPANAALPTISGTAEVGQSLTAASDGTWTGNPAPTLARNWQRNGVDIPGATASSYRLVDADNGASIRLRVTATNSQGSASAHSQAVTVAAFVAPAVTAAAISPSSGGVGTTFTASHTAAGNPVPTIGYQWRLNGTAIAGATASTYQAAAAGSLTVVVTATNSQGTASRESNATSVTTAASGSVFEIGVFAAGVFV